VNAERFAFLAGELRKIAREHDEQTAVLDPSHALQQCARIDGVVRGLLWLNFQMLKELANRDGKDVDAPEGKK
jgi:hypothetical protein